MKHIARIVFVALVASQLIGCGDSGTVKSESIDSYQKAGRAAGDEVQKASAGGDGQR